MFNLRALSTYSFVRPVPVLIRLEIVLSFSIIHVISGRMLDNDFTVCITIIFYKCQKFRTMHKDDTFIF